MYSETAATSSSPADVGCYEECVVTDDFGIVISPVATAGSPPDSPLAGSASERAGIPKSFSGKITKKSTSVLKLILKCQINASVWSELVLCFLFPTSFIYDIHGSFHEISLNCMHVCL